MLPNINAAIINEASRNGATSNVRIVSFDDRLMARSKPIALSQRTAHSKRIDRSQPIDLNKPIAHNHAGLTPGQQGQRLQTVPDHIDWTAVISFP